MRAAMLLVLASTALRAAACATPDVSYIDGGVPVLIECLRHYPSDYYAISLEIGGVPVPDARYVLTLYDPESGLVDYGIACTAPPHAAGAVDVTIRYTALFGAPEQDPDVYPHAFTYLGAPHIDSFSPTEHSIKRDPRPCKIVGQGFSVVNTPEVFFGEMQATDVAVDSSGKYLTCTPPDFPGGDWPLFVGVSVRNLAGDSATARGVYTYQAVAPEVTYLESYVPAWSYDEWVTIEVGNIVEDSITILVDNAFYKTYKPNLSGGANGSYFIIFNNRPPGTASITLINGDGGVLTLENAITFYGQPATRFHQVDLNHNYRIEMTELLRVIQFYNAGGLHCDDTGEDGYVPDWWPNQTCVPYDADNDPQDWVINLNELLEIIQYFNRFGYRPCPDAPDTFCPPS